MEKNWKNLLLKSGLPFEYEVKQKFVENQCTVWDEYQYSKLDENNIEKDFSYDLDANYWRGCSIDFMIECKYKTKETDWFFLPDSYAYQDEVVSDDFFNITDYFVNERFKFGRTNFREKEYLGPLCQKGVEIFENNYVESNIRKAINQISYAFVEKIIQGIDEQLNVETFYDTAFVSIPIIVTNAKLNIINVDISTQDIKKANKVEDISEQKSFVVHRRKISNDLKKHNLKKLNEYFNSTNKEYAEKHLCGHQNVELLIETLSEMPSTILIMSHSDEEDNYKKLFDYVNELIIEKHPDQIRKRMPKSKKIIEVENQLEEILKRKNNYT
jgi:hypothetical protein